MTSPPINLNKARKARRKEVEALEAERNRIVFGLTKAQRAKARAEARAAARGLDGRLRSPPPSGETE